MSKRSHRPLLTLALLATAGLFPIASVFAAGAKEKPAKKADNAAGAKAETKPPAAIPSSDILAREPMTEKAQVQHVLIGWKDLEPNFRGGMDDRAKTRTHEEANRLAREVLEKARAGADFAQLMKDFSEDPGSAASGTSYEATPTAGLVPPFKSLALRLAVGEVGVVETTYGWHIIKRVE